MDIPADSILRLKVIGAFIATPYDRILNVLHYRAVSAITGSDADSALADFITQWKSQVMQRLCDNYTVTYAIRELRAQIIFPADLTYEEVQPVDLANGVGALTASGASSQRAAGCLTRRSYKAGRRGIGRLFFGPLAPNFISGDSLVEDPLGDGDLRDVVSALGESIATPGGTFNPCIFGSVNATGAATDAQMDVRAQAWAPLVSYMRTRRLNSL